MALDSTVGGPSANSYVTLAAAGDYFLGRLSASEWDDADEPDRESALMMATARLDMETFVGLPVTTTQRLQWPRYGVPDRLYGFDYPSDSIPRPVQEATFELALAALKDPTLFEGGGDLSEFSHLSLGSLDVTPRSSSSGALPSVVLRLIAPVRSGGFQARVVRA
jgi:hypothetical protein